MATRLYSHPDCLNHENPPGHPERVDRLRAIEAVLSDPIFKPLERVEAPMGAREDILRAHPEHHIDAIAAASPEEGWRALDGDTSMSPGSLTAAYRAVGANVAAAHAVRDGAASNAFVACRPPGHHAETATPMGFCLFGNVVIGARAALERDDVEKVAIIDFDVHHGNGTQDLVWNDDRILFVSSHQMPLYPGSGARGERGAHGSVVNVPLDPGTGGAAYMRLFEREMAPAVDDFAPDMIFVSAGFDAHINDPLANIALTADDFGDITGAICDLADHHCDGRVVSTLEGGYDLEGLASSVAAHVKVLMERGK